MRLWKKMRWMFRYSLVLGAECADLKYFQQLPANFLQKYYTFCISDKISPLPKIPEVSTCNTHAHTNTKQIYSRFKTKSARFSMHVFLNPQVLHELNISTFRQITLTKRQNFCAFGKILIFSRIFTKVQHNFHYMRCINPTLQNISAQEIQRFQYRTEIVEFLARLSFSMLDLCNACFENCAAFL